MNLYVRAESFIELNLKYLKDDMKREERVTCIGEQSILESHREVKNNPSAAAPEENGEYYK